jgi:hypothetical protein
VTEARKAEIVRALQAGGSLVQLKQSILDGQACRDSRRSTQGCGCFCCDLVMFLGPHFIERIMRYVER